MELGKIPSCTEKGKRSGKKTKAEGGDRFEKEIKEARKEGGDEFSVDRRKDNSTQPRTSCWRFLFSNFFESFSAGGCMTATQQMKNDRLKTEK